MSDSFRRVFEIWQEYPLSADTRWPFSEFVWGQARYFSWQAIASCLLTSVSSKLLKVHVVDQGGDKLSASPFYFCLKILKIHLLNQMNYWIIAPNLIACAGRSLKLCSLPGSATSGQIDRNQCNFLRVIRNFRWSQWFFMSHWIQIITWSWLYHPIISFNFFASIRRSVWRILFRPTDETGWYGGENRERQAADVEGCYAQRRKKTIY